MDRAAALSGENEIRSSSVSRKSDVLMPLETEKGDTELGLVGA